MRPCFFLTHQFTRVGWCCREHEFSYREGAFANYSKAMRMRSSHKVKFDVLLTNYEMVNVDCTTLNSIDWAVIVIDEAHRLKSQQSLVSASVLLYTPPHTHTGRIAAQHEKMEHSSFLLLLQHVIPQQTTASRVLCGWVVTGHRIESRHEVMFVWLWFGLLPL